MQLLIAFPTILSSMKINLEKQPAEMQKKITKDQEIDELLIISTIPMLLLN